MKQGVKILTALLILAMVLTFVPVKIGAVPSYATVSTDKIYYAVNETVTFTLTSNGSRNNLWLYRIDGQWEKSFIDVGTSFTQAFGWEGTYEALLETWDNYGSFKSNRIIFHVGEPTTITTAPTYSTVTIPKNTFNVGENVTFSLSTNGGVNSLWIYAPGANGEPSTTGTEYDKLGNTKTLSFSTPGKYAALVEAWNGVGSLQSEKIYFTVVDPNATTKPTTAPTTQPTTKPTTAPTTQPTTKPTTAPTTQPTTKPTTIPTTQPTTAPTTAPTSAPTTRPTTAPTTVTTATSTEITTTAPTSAPTTQPTAVSTTLPTEPVTQSTAASTTQPQGGAKTTGQTVSKTPATTHQGGNGGDKQTGQDLGGWIWLLLILIVCIVIVGVLLVIKYKDRMEE